MSFKPKFKKFSTTSYSKDKDFLNAIITSNINFIPKNKKLKSTLNSLLRIYATIILLVTSLSLGMLALTDNFVNNHKTLISIIEAIVFVSLALDVVLRWYTSEVRIKKGNWSYLLFPITINGFILIISLLPSLYLINVWTGKNIDIFNTFENMKFLRIFRILLLVNLVPGIQIFVRVLKKEKSVLYMVFTIVIITIILFALVIYNIEHNIGLDGIKYSDEIAAKSAGTSLQFTSFWDALYFSTITLTTIGFGDKSPHTTAGQAVTIIMSIIGIAVLATPSGVIAGGFISEIKQTKKEKQKNK